MVVLVFGLSTFDSGFSSADEERVCGELGRAFVISFNLSSLIMKNF